MLSRRTLIIVLFSVLLLYFVCRDFSVADFTGLLTSARLDMLAVAFPLYLVATLLKAWRFSILLEEQHIPIGQLYRISSYHNLYNMVLPARTGELTLIYYLNTIAGIKGGYALHSLVVARVLDLMVIALLFLGSFTLFSWDSMPAILTIAALTTVMVSFASLLMFNKLIGIFRHLFMYTVSFLRIDQIKIGKKITDKVDTVSKEFISREINDRFLRLVLSTLTIWLCLYTYFYLIMLSLGIDISFFKAIAGSTGMVLTSALPINGIGSLGIYEAGWTAGLILVGVERSLATLSSLSSHIIQFVICLLNAFFSILAGYLLKH